MSWIVETLNEIVDRELEALPEDMRARFVRIAELIQAVGLPNVREFYVAASGMRVVVVRAFVKKTQVTPNSEIDIALKRAQEIER